VNENNAVAKVLKNALVQKKKKILRLKKHQATQPKENGKKTQKN